MKKILGISLMLVLLFAFFACTESKTAEKPAATSIVITGKNSGGGTDTDPKWTEVELATLDVTEGKDGFVMSNKVTVTNTSDTKVAITAYSSESDAEGKDITEYVDQILYVGGEDGNWTLKSDVTLKSEQSEQASVISEGGPTDLTAYVKYTVQITGPLTFTYTPDSGEPMIVTCTADIDYTRTSTNGVLALKLTNSGDIDQNTSVSSKGIAKFGENGDETVNALVGVDVTYSGTVTVTVNGQTGSYAPTYKVDSNGNKINMSITGLEAPDYDAQATNTIVVTFGTGQFSMPGTNGKTYTATLSDEYTFTLNIKQTN